MNLQQCTIAELEANRMLLHPSVVAQQGTDLLARQKRCQIDNLYQQRAALELHQLFQKNALRYFFIKGIVLSQLLYGRANARQSRDVDVVVHPDDVVRATKLLVEAGYTEIYTATLNILQRHAYQTTHKDYSFCRANDQVLVELHWRLYVNDSLMDLSAFDAFHNLQQVCLANSSLPTLSSEHLLLYLFMHGSQHLYARAQWLYDLQAMIVVEGLDKGVFFKLVEHVHAERVVAFGLYMLYRHQLLKDLSWLRYVCVDARMQLGCVLNNSIAKRNGKAEFVDALKGLVIARHSKYYFRLANVYRYSAKDFERFNFSRTWFFLYSWVPLVRLVNKVTSLIRLSLCKK